MADASTKDLVSAQLVSEHEAANRHWEELCKMQDLDEQAEQVRVCVRGWVDECGCMYTECMYVHLCIHTYTQVQYMDSVTCKLTCTYMRMCVNTYIGLYVCMYVLIACSVCSCTYVRTCVLPCDSSLTPPPHHPPPPV